MFKSKLSKIVSFLIAFAIVVTLSCTTLAVEETNTLSSDDQSSLSATDADTNADVAADDSDTLANTDQQQNIVKNDLFLSGDNVTMDQLVDGNVFVTGRNVTITGQVNGNLFVAAETVSFKNSYIVNTAFIAAKTVDFDAAANDIYCVCNSLNVSYDSYIVRDVNIVAKDINFIGYVGRNANMTAQKINLGNPNEKSASAYIAGNFNYEATKVSFHSDNEESTVADNDEEAMAKVVAGESKTTITNNDENENQNNKNINVRHLVSNIVVALIVYFITLWLFPKKIDEHVEAITKKPLKTLGLGALALIIVPLASILLLITILGAPIGILALLIYFIAIALAKPIVNVALARLIKNKFKLSNIWLEILAVAAIAVILWALDLIPVANCIIGLIIILLGLGFMTLSVTANNKHSSKDKKTKKSKKDSKNEVTESKEDKE